MGEVLLAEDPILRRRVAIKRLHPQTVGDADAAARLLIEARAAASLDHPNICGVFEVGEDESGPFIVMPYVEGETLAARLARGPVPLDQAIDIATRVADALSAAHAQGIVHRDIKPANIMIGPRGAVRVMDFGLARQVMTRPGALGTETTMASLTQAGMTLGTPAYMSPEQARGEAVDARSDLFSLGAVLYEMLAGHRPFRGASLAEIVSAVLAHDPPLPSGLPPELHRIVSKTLRKDRNDRYQSAADLLVDLEDVARTSGRGPSASDASGRPGLPVAVPATAWTRHQLRLLGGLVVVAVLVVSALLWRTRSGPAAVVGGEAPRIASIAVLPLENLSADPNQGYFAAGMTEALIAELARIKSLRVISRTSTGQYIGTTKSMPEIARELQVDGIVEGSVVREGDTVRITAQLIHGSTDRHLWANSYEGTMREVLALQRRVAAAITGELRATLAPEHASAITTARTVDPAAQDLYLRGRELFNAGIKAAPTERLQLLTQAIRAYEEALTHEPDWSQAWSAIAQARHWLVMPTTNPDELFPASREAALKALALDDSNSEAHGSLAYVSAAYYWDWATAEREFQRARDLNRTTPYNHGFGMMLSALGRHDESRARFDEALLRDPLNLALQWNAAMGRARARDYAEAIRLAHGRWPHVEGWARLWQGRPQEALSAFETARPLDVEARAGIAASMAKMGRTADARAMLPSLDAASASRDLLDLARAQAALGDRDLTLSTLERAYAVRLQWLGVINVEPSFDNLRNEPRFVDLLRRMGIRP